LKQILLKGAKDSHLSTWLPRYCGRFLLVEMWRRAKSFELLQVKAVFRCMIGRCNLLTKSKHVNV